MENFEDRFEVLHLESDNNVGFDFPPLLNDEYEEEDDHFRAAEEGIVDPFLFVSSKYYAFKRDLAEYLILGWKNDVLIQPDIIMELDDNFFPHKEGMPLELWRKGCLKKLARFKRGFTLQRTVNEGDRLFSTKQPNCIVPYIEEWPSIVRNAHFVDGFHLSVDDTMAKIGEQKWLIGSNIQEIPKPFIDEMVKTYGGCKFGDQNTHTSGEGRSFRQYTEHHKIPVVEQEEFMNNLKATYSVCLKPIHKYSRVLPNASTIFIYVCHRGTRFSEKKPEYDLHTDKQRQCSIAKHVGCKFVVKVICPNDTE